MIDKQKLEELLVKNWSSFLDTKKLMVRLLQDVTAHADTFHIVPSAQKPKSMVQISMSRFQPTEAGGFLLWAEFVVPRETECHTGTVEYHLLFDGTLTLRQIMGTKLIKA